MILDIKKNYFLTIILSSSLEKNKKDLYKVKIKSFLKNNLFKIYKV